MKILYFGTVCDLNVYEKFLSKCKSKPSVATIVFESSLLEGFKENGIDIDVYSCPMIPTFPNCKLLKWGNIKNNLVSGYECTWLKTINLPILKQLSRKLNGRSVIKKWIKSNSDKDCIVLTYGISPFLSKDILSLCKKHFVKCCAIVPDLPRDMYINLSHKSVITKLKDLYLKPTIKIQGQFDGYIYLTDAMSHVINKKKPYVVVEGILNEYAVDSININKPIARGIMYAGALNRKFGVINLLDSFEKADIPDTELWLFGDGNAVDEIKSRAKDNSKIKFFGHLHRDLILKYEKEASLLVNPRSCNDEFTKYSFPSKTIEYMYSGTPLLTTRLSGIPEEYFNYVFSIPDNSVECLEKAFHDIFSLSDEELTEVGEKAKCFVAEYKNPRIQTQRIVSFFKDITEEVL